MEEQYKITGGILQLIGMGCLVFAAYLAAGSAAALAAGGLVLILLGHLVFPRP